MKDRQAMMNPDKAVDDTLRIYEWSGAYTGARHALNNAVRDMFDYYVRKTELNKGAIAEEIDVRTKLRAALAAIDDQDSAKFVADKRDADVLLWVLDEAIELLIRYVR
jgi:hypothetical protein